MIEQRTVYEYAVEMHDHDSASVTIATVYVSERRPESDRDNRAEILCKRNHGWMFAGNHVEYSSHGPTGLFKTITQNDDGTFTQVEGGSYISPWKESDFYKM